MLLYQRPWSPDGTFCTYIAGHSAAIFIWHSSEGPERPQLPHLCYLYFCYLYLLHFICTLLYQRPWSPDGTFAHILQAIVPQYSFGTVVKVQRGRSYLILARCYSGHRAQVISFPSLAHGGLGSHVALCSGSWWPLFHFNLHSCLWLMVATTGLKYI